VSDGEAEGVFKRSSMAIEIENSYRRDTVVYHVPKESEDSVVSELNFFKSVTRNKRTSIDHLERSMPRFVAFEPTQTVMDMKRKLYKLLRGAFSNDIEDDEQLNKAI
jgi:hypothetical protein